MDKRAKVIWIILGCIVILSGVFLVYENYNGKLLTASGTKTQQTAEAADPGKVMTEKEVKADAKEMVEIMESTHPIFLEGETEKYKEARERFLLETNKSITVGQFGISVSRYLSSIQDGHTRIGWKETEYLEANWRYADGKLNLLDDKNKITDKTVTKINGVDIQEILNVVKELFPAENYAAEAMNCTGYTKGKRLLAYAGVDCNKDMVLTVESGNGEEAVKTKFTTGGAMYSGNFEISSRRIDDKTVYVKFGVCDMNRDLNKVTDDLKQAVRDGVKNVIIDIMDNPGGNSQACNALLDALKIKPGNFGSVIRYSPLAAKKYGYSKKSGFTTYERSNEAVPNPDINLYILTNEDTFSSAQWMATWVKDGRLGIVVGRASSNMPSSFGDVLSFQLSNSKLKGQISYKKWTRPDKTKDSERALEPDVYVDYSENILNKTLELIASKK